jgi:RNA 2',3'-cyclic 3'-phosphodiesterase
MMRLFIAVDLDAAARAAVEDAMRRLRDRAERRRRGLSRGVRWVDPRNLHLTLHFIGEADDDHASALQSGLVAPLAVEPANVGFGGWGVFPSRGAARVIWIGVTDGAATLSRAHAELAKRLVAAGITPEARPFSPHLTIGRVRVPSETDWNELVRESGLPPAFDSAMLDSVLYRSHLSPAGPAYEALTRTPFAGTAESGPEPDGRMP